MINFNGRFLLSGLAAGLLALPTAQAVAEETTCTGTLLAVTVDNLRVPQGASCKLFGTRVKGTITVETSALLRAENVMVIGNVQGEGARSVSVIEQSRVGGSVPIVQNNGGGTVRRNVIDGNLQCKENNPAPVGDDNVVGGSKEDQCARLRA
jgi:hypothetical protein